MRYYFLGLKNFSNHIKELHIFKLYHLPIANKFLMHGYPNIVPIVTLFKPYDVEISTDQTITIILNWHGQSIPSTPLHYGHVT